MTKIKAALIHFSISFLLVAGLLAFAYWVWYGQVYVGISGVLEPVKMLVIVDVVLGPFLTFLIFKTGKKSLKLDLSIIGVVQFMALVYGAYILYLGKPTVVAWKGNAFEIIAQKNILPALDDSISSQISFFSPPIYAIINPEKVNQNQSVFDQQAFLLPFSLSNPLLEPNSIGPDQVNLVLKENSHEWESFSKKSEVQSFLMIDQAWYAVMLVKNEKLLKIIQAGSATSD